MTRRWARAAAMPVVAMVAVVTAVGALGWAVWGQNAQPLGAQLTVADSRGAPDTGTAWAAG